MKADKFVLTLELGNDRMRNWGDIARALRQVADHIDGPSDEFPLEGDFNSVRDENGNHVGGWCCTK